MWCRWFCNGPELCRIKPLLGGCLKKPQTSPHPRAECLFLLILISIKFFLNHNVVDVLFQWLYLEKYYLLLVWAMQSLFHIVANPHSLMRGCSLGRWPACLLAFLPRAGGTCGVKPGRPRGRFAEAVISPFPCNNLFQSLSPTRDAGGGVHQGWGCRALGIKSSLPCCTKVGNYEFISMSFCLLGICTTHVVSVCFIYL